MVNAAANQDAMGGMPPFSSAIRWETWEFQLKLLIVDKGLVAEKKKVNFLLKSLGLETLEKVIDWCSPEDPQDVGYQSLLVLLRSKFIIKKNKFALRLGILNEKQQAAETAREYFAKMTQKFGQCELEKITPDEYGVLVLLKGLANDELRDYLMNPVNDISTVEKLEQLAIAFEDSRKASRDIKSVGKEAVQPMMINVVGKGVPVCDGCGKQHGKGRCAAKEVECWICNETGHFARLCKTRKVKEKQKQNQISGNESECDDKNYSCNGIYPGYEGVLSVTSGKDMDYPPVFVRLKVNGRRQRFQHDTGSGVSVISKSVWAQLGKPKLVGCANFRSYTGVIKAWGKCLIEACLGGVQRELWVTVVDRGKSLIGRDWMKALNVRQTLHEQPYRRRDCCCKNKQTVFREEKEQEKEIKRRVKYRNLRAVLLK